MSPSRKPRKQRYRPFVPRTSEPTDRELQILRGMADGLSNKEIGARLYLAEDTVKTHSRRLFMRTGARGRDHVVRIGFERGWLTPSNEGLEPVELVDGEARLLRLISDGWPYPEIGRRLFISGDTVKRRAHEMFGELGARNRAHATRKGFDHGLLTGAGDAS